MNHYAVWKSLLVVLLLGRFWSDLDLWSEPIGPHLGLWWENPGKGQADSLGIRWGFRSEHLNATISFNQLSAQSPQGIDLAKLHFNLRSPVLELGMLAAPEYWTCLSASLSSLEAVLPGDPARGRHTAWFKHPLPLRFSSLARSDSARMIGLGLGIPNRLSAMFFRTVSGDWAGWDHGGIRGQIPWQSQAGEAAWSARLGLAWYGSRFLPNGTDSLWLPAGDGSGQLIHLSPDWWLGHDLLMPQSLGHGQLSLDIASQSWRLVILGQHSRPYGREAGFSLCGALTFLSHLSDGRLIAKLDLADSYADPAYRDAHGQAASARNNLKFKAHFLPWPELALTAGLGQAFGSLPSPAEYSARYLAQDFAWQAGIAYRGTSLQGGVSWSETRSRDESGLVELREILDGDVSLTLEGALSCKLGLDFALAFIAWQTSHWKLAPQLLIGLESEMLRVHFKAAGGWTTPLGRAAGPALVAAGLELSLAWTFPAGGKLEIRGAVALPEGCTIATLANAGSTDWMAGLERRIELSLNP